MYENWNKIRPKFHSLTKIEIKITYLVFGEKTDRFCSSTYEHRRASALLRNIRNMDLCGKKPIISVTYENERISIKKQLTLLKMCVTSLLRVWSTGRFMAVLWVFM